MAIFTTTDRDAVKDALLVAASEGVASVSIGGQAVQTLSLDQLYNLLTLIQQDLATANGRHGMRVVKTIPPAAG